MINKLFIPTLLFSVSVAAGANEITKFSDLKGKTISPVEIVIPTLGIECTPKNMIGSKERALFGGRFIDLTERDLGYEPHFGAMSIFNSNEKNRHNPGCDKFNSQYNAITMIGLDFESSTIEFDVIGANFEKDLGGDGNAFTNLRILACPFKRAHVVNSKRITTKCEFKPLEKKKAPAETNAIISLWNKFLGTEVKPPQATNQLQSVNDMLRDGFTSDEIVVTYSLGDNSDTVPRVGYIECKNESEGVLIRYAVLKERPSGGLAACR